MAIDDDFEAMKYVDCMKGASFDTRGIKDEMSPCFETIKFLTSTDSNASDGFEAFRRKTFKNTQNQHIRAMC